MDGGEAGRSVHEYVNEAGCATSWPLLLGLRRKPHRGLSHRPMLLTIRTRHKDHSPTKGGPNFKLTDNSLP